VISTTNTLILDIVVVGPVLLRDGLLDHVLLHDRLFHDSLFHNRHRLLDDGLFVNGYSTTSSSTATSSTTGASATRSSTTSAVGVEEDRGGGVDDGRERRRALRRRARGGLLLELGELDRDLAIVLGLVGRVASAREEPPHGAAKETQVGPVPLLREAAVEAEEGIALLVGGGDDAMLTSTWTVSTRTSGRTAVVRRRFMVERGG